MPSRRSKSKIKVGVSSCLLGEKVRWDGNHKQDRTVKDGLGRLFEWVPTCPEVEIGMGIPRETVQLTGNSETPRMVGNTTGTDWTQRMNRYSRKRSTELAKMDVCGYIFKSKSPSCGITRIPVTSKNGKTIRYGRGLFAEAFIRRCALVPVEDEGRLHDARIRENFITRVYAYNRLSHLLQGRCSRKALVRGERISGSVRLPGTGVGAGSNFRRSTKNVFRMAAIARRKTLSLRRGIGTPAECVVRHRSLFPNTL